MPRHNIIKLQKEGGWELWWGACEKERERLTETERKTQEDREEAKIRENKAIKAVDKNNTTYSGKNTELVKISYLRPEWSEDLEHLPSAERKNKTKTMNPEFYMNKKCSSQKNAKYIFK